MNSDEEMAKVMGKERWSPNWNPSTNISQAMMVLGKFPAWELFKNVLDEYGCNIWPDKLDMGTYVFGGWVKTREFAIRLAIEKVMEEEE